MALRRSEMSEADRLRAREQARARYCHTKEGHARRVYLRLLNTPGRIKKPREATLCRWGIHQLPDGRWSDENFTDPAP